MKKEFIHTKLFSLLVVVTLWGLSTPLWGQAIDRESFRVRFSVRNDDGIPVRNAIIVQDGNTEIGRTDEDGKVFIHIKPDATIEIHSVEYNQQEISIDNRQEIDVILYPKELAIEEIVVVGKAVPSQKVAFEPTDIEVKGDYLHLRTRFRVPTVHYSTDTRLIVQPILVDAATGGESLLHPYVAQGNRFTVARERAFGFQMENDPLNCYRVQATINKDDNLVSYHDSLYVRYGNDDYLARVLVAIEDYRKVLYLDTLVIAKGTSNPLRFLDYDLGVSKLNEAPLNPVPEMAFFQDKGVTRIVFAPSSSTIDRNHAVNRKELSQMESILTRFRTDSMITLRSLVLEGFSSPDGNAEQNERLARRRTAALMESVRGMLGPLASSIKMESASTNSSWSDVADYLEQSGKKEQAAQVRRTIYPYRRDPISQGIAMRRLPFYKTDVVQVLSLMRRVEYTIDYSEFRTMDDEEIWNLYATEPRRLTRYDYHRLIETSPDEQRDDLLRQSLKAYPGFLLAANRLAVSLIEKDTTDLTLLQPFIKNGTAPAAVIANQLKMQLMLKNIGEAHALIELLPDTEEYLYPKAVIKALNGHFAEAYEVMGPHGGLNEVLLLLALKRDEEAYRKVRLLDQSNPKVLYIRAICADRLEDITDAMYSMKEALRLDPALANIARVDSDAADIFNLVNDL